MNRTILLQPGFILQHQNYRETSLLLDILTRDYGVVSLVAKGVRRKKSVAAGLLQCFTALNLSFSGKGELKTLTNVEAGAMLEPLTGLPLYSGFYINELVSHFLYPSAPCPGVFKIYQQCLQQLIEQKSLEQTLRFFELDLINLLGYGVRLDLDVQTAQLVKSDYRYHFVGNSGIIKNPTGYISGQTLKALEARTSLTEQNLQEAKQLTRQMINFFLQGKTLKSRTVIAAVINKL